MIMIEVQFSCIRIINISNGELKAKNHNYFLTNNNSFQVIVKTNNSFRNDQKRLLTF